MSLVAIDSADDPRLEAFRNIREKDLQRRDGLFIIEGRQVLQQALTSDYRMRAMLVSEATYLVHPQLADLDAPLYVAPNAVMSEIAGFAMHRGTLALGERKPELDLDALLADAPSDARVVVLLGVNNHDNVGGIFRSAAAFGAYAVLLDDQASDPLYRKAIRVSCAASLLVPWVNAKPQAELLMALARHGYQTLALTPGRTSRPLRQLSGSTERLALLLGAEGPGLDAAVIAAADYPVVIPMTDRIDSLNVAVAASIALYELSATALARK